MQFDLYCMECLVRHQAELAAAQGGGEKGYRFLRESMRLLLDAPEGVGAPYLTAEFNRLYDETYGGGDYYAEIRAESNRLMLQKLPGIRARIAAADDPLLMALRFAQVGNYIDFGALRDGVQADVLDRLLDGAAELPIDQEEYRRFRDDLSRAGKLVYLGDNAGEIVADLALIETVRAAFPDLDVVFAVRGRPVLNDVTRGDASMVGMDKAARIVDNGTGIPGTDPARVGPELRAELETAGVILSKGQGNFETLCPSGWNAYYMFLCKCDRFVKMFGVPHLTGMFRSERRMPAIDPYQ